MFVEYSLVNQEEAPSDVRQVRGEQIWLNEFINCDCDSILSRNIYMDEVRKINDLVDNTGQMLKFSKIRRKYPKCRVSCLRYF